jgi:endonuclease/exonuclease/phosphatase family metal-dependent hydrolase
MKLPTTLPTTLAVFCVAAFAFIACTPDEQERDLLIIAQWNLQALFDGHEAGNEYREFREAEGWTAEKYQARITAFSQAVLRMTQGVPDVIGFTELENAAVLEALVSGELSRHGYKWTAFANIAGAPIGLGFISRFPLIDVRAHSITVNGETAPRPILEVRIEPDGQPLVLLLGHWKSKLGGAEATAALRRASARVVHRRLSEIKAAEAGTPVIVMGDLNENHDEFHRHAGELFSALLPDETEAALMASRHLQGFLPGYSHSPPAVNFLVISEEKPPQARSFPDGVHALYSPWDREKTGGSYFFRDRWQTIDHFLLSAAFFDGAGWEFAYSAVINSEPFTSADGTPNSYNARSGRGLSDHLPLVLYLWQATELSE